MQETSLIFWAFLLEETGLAEMVVAISLVYLLLYIRLSVKIASPST